MALLLGLRLVASRLQAGRTLLKLQRIDRDDFCTSVLAGASPPKKWIRACSRLFRLLRTLSAVLGLEGVRKLSYLILQSIYWYRERMRHCIVKKRIDIGKGCSMALYCEASIDREKACRIGIATFYNLDAAKMKAKHSCSNVLEMRNRMKTRNIACRKYFQFVFLWKKFLHAAPLECEGTEDSM